MVQSNWCAVFKKCRRICESVILFDKPILPESDSINLLEHPQVPLKIPNHLVIIIGNEPISYCDLVNFITWSLPHGIAFISFYDHKNGLIADLLFKAVVKCNKNILSLIKWGRAFEESLKISSKQMINGFKWSPKIKVSVLTKEDSKSFFVDTVVRLCSTTCDISLINESIIDECIKSSLLTSEPDLAIVCGNTSSSFGFQPWLTRVTEFLMLPTHHNIRIKDFNKILCQYGAVEQRFGK